jgi:hypothetical protein
MEPVFTLPYTEFVVAEQLSKSLGKAQGYAVCVPLSRQQRGMDLLVHNLRTGKSATVQIKSSRAYANRSSRNRLPRRAYDYHLWFNAFDTGAPTADFYALIGLFPRRRLSSRRLSRARRPSNWWQSIILILPANRVRGLVRSVARQRDRFFYVGFDESLKRVALTRGAPTPRPWTKHLLRHSVSALRRFLA